MVHYPPVLLGLRQLHLKLSIQLWNDLVDLYPADVSANALSTAPAEVQLPQIVHTLQLRVSCIKPALWAECFGVGEYGCIAVRDPWVDADDCSRGEMVSVDVETASRYVPLHQETN